MTASGIHVKDPPHHSQGGTLESSLLETEGMKSMIMNFAAKAKRGEISEGEAAAIQGLLNQINSVLVPALYADKNASQGLLDTAYDAVNTCNNNRDSWVQDTLSGMNNDVDNKSLIHNNCRAQENVTLTNLTNYCEALEAQACFWDLCTVPNFDNGDSDAVDEYICCLQDFFALNRPSYYEKRTNCIDATRLHHDQTAECDSDQEDFEVEFCNRESDIQSYCDGYQTCRCDAESAFESVLSNTEELESIFQAQFVALKMLTCYGDAILANDTDLSRCGSVGKDCELDYPDTCPMIDYKEPDARIDCTEPHANYPCEVGFHNEFYSQYDNSCTPVNDCIACTDMDVKNGEYTGAASCPTDTPEMSGDISEGNTAENNIAVDHGIDLSTKPDGTLTDGGVSFCAAHGCGHQDNGKRWACCVSGPNNVFRTRFPSLILSGPCKNTNKVWCTKDGIVQKDDSVNLQDFLPLTTP